VILRPRPALLLLVLAPATAWCGGDGTADGAALHAAHCTRCHDASVYTRESRQVNNLEELRARVRQCELVAEAGWFAEEVEAVVQYINDGYYRF
jgi:cytochrome c553